MTRNANLHQRIAKIVLADGRTIVSAQHEEHILTFIESTIKLFDNVAFVEILDPLTSPVKSANLQTAGEGPIPKLATRGR